MRGCAEGLHCENPTAMLALESTSVDTAAARAPEEFVADTILRLSIEPVQRAVLRSVDVVKSNCALWRLARGTWTASRITTASSSTTTLNVRLSSRRSLAGKNETGMHSCLDSKPKLAGWRRRQEEASPWRREYRPRNGQATQQAPAAPGSPDA